MFSAFLSLGGDLRHNWNEEVVQCTWRTFWAEKMGRVYPHLPRSLWSSLKTKQDNNGLVCLFRTHLSNFVAVCLSTFKPALRIIFYRIA